MKSLSLTKQGNIGEKKHNYVRKVEKKSYKEAEIVEKIKREGGAAAVIQMHA